MATIKDKITEDMKAAMRSQDKERLATIRLILAALKQREVDERITLTDEHILAILDKMIKQRRESIVQYEAGNRPELAKKEADEILIIQAYLPLNSAILERHLLIKLKRAVQLRQRNGKVMAILKPKLQGCRYWRSEGRLKINLQVRSVDNSYTS